MSMKRFNNSSKWFEFRPKRIVLSASSATPPGGGGASSGSSPAAPASPTGAPGGASPAPPTGTGAPPVTPTGTTPTTPPTTTPTDNAQNLAQLRESHEFLSKLGDKSKVEGAVTQFTKLETEAAALADELGYTEESFREAFADDPVTILQHLRAEKAREVRDGSAERDPAKIIDRKLQPINRYLQTQIAKEANARVEGEFNRMFTGHDLFKGKSDVPAEVREAINDTFLESLKYDKKVQQQLIDGNVSGLTKYFNDAVSRVIASVNAYTKWSGGTPGAPAKGTPGAPATTPTTTTAPGDGKRPANFIQSLIDGEEEAFQQLAVTRR